MSSLGSILRDERERRNLSIQQVSADTNIREKIIIAIENDDFDSMPQPYMRSFIRKYSTFLKISDEAKDSIASHPFMQDGATPTPARSASAGATISKDYLKLYGKADTIAARQSLIITVISVVAGIVLLASLYYVFLEDTFRLFKSDTVTTVIAADSVYAGEGDGEELDLRIAAEEEATLQVDSLVLQADAVDRIWMSVVADGTKSSELILEKGATRTWRAENEFTLSLGNAGGALFTLNGEKLQKFGEIGTVVRKIRITRNTVTISNIAFPLRERLLSTQLERDSIEAERKREMQMQ